MDTLKVGQMTFHWLSGGKIHLDGGAMFGVVPKPLWSRKYQSNDLNQIPLRTDPIFLKHQGKNILIESGIGYGKLDEKQKKIFGVTEESRIENNLAELDLTPADIDYILMTHLHFDHASGLTKREGNRLISMFENARIIVSKTEWEEMKQPNIRSKNTYWEENWKPVESQVDAFIEMTEPIPGVRMIHTGGHSNGHSIVIFDSGEGLVYHMADLMPTHAHQNPLWVLAYDDYPMTSIDQKQRWLQEAYDEEAWFVFYHDDVYRAIQWSKEGKKVKNELKREIG